MFYINSLIKLALLGGGIYFLIPVTNFFKNTENINPYYWSNKISVNEPVLDCEQHNRHYRVYLTAKESGDWNESSAKDKITLSVFDVKSNNWVYGGTKNISEESKWTNWALRATGQEVSLQVPAIDDNQYQQLQYIALDCKNNKMASSHQHSHQEVNINIAHLSSKRDQQIIEFEFNDRNCRQKGNKKECDISFKKQNNLKWVDGFQPKAYF